MQVESGEGVLNMAGDNASGLTLEPTQNFRGNSLSYLGDYADIMDITEADDD